MRCILLIGHSFKANGTVLWASRSTLKFQEGTKDPFCYLLSQLGIDVSVSFSTRPTLPYSWHEFWRPQSAPIRPWNFDVSIDQFRSIKTHLNNRLHHEALGNTHRVYGVNLDIERDLPVSWSLIEILSVNKHWVIAWEYTLALHMTAA